MHTHSIQFGKSHGHSHQSKMPRTGPQPATPHTASPRRQLLGGHMATVQGKPEGDEQHQELVRQSQKWVAQTFYGEMLKQMRNSPFKDKMFSGGKGAESFQEMFDQKLADKMSRGSGKKLVDAMVDKIEQHRAHAAASSTTAETQAGEGHVPQSHAPETHAPESHAPESHETGHHMRVNRSAGPNHTGAITWHRITPNPDDQPDVAAQVGGMALNQPTPNPRPIAAMVSPALKPVLDLETLLGELLTEHRKLLGHVEFQLDSMQQMNTRQMEVARTLQESSRLRINTLELRRRMLVQQIARMNQLKTEPKIPQLAQMFPQRRGQLLKLRADLEAVMKQVQSKSFVSSRVASAVLGHLNTAMRILAGAVGGGGVYTNRGVAKVARRIGVMEAVG